jgi:hypothetical protein
VYVPSSTAEKDDTVTSSPLRLAQCCAQTTGPTSLKEPYLSAFSALAKKTGWDETVLFEVLRKLRLKRTVADDIMDESYTNH